MIRDPFDRRRKIKVVAGVLAVGLLMSFLVAAVIIYFDRVRPRF